MAKDKSPEEIVADTEIALLNSQPCPYCRMYDGTHVPGCKYLLHKGNVDAARRVSGKTSDKTVVAGTGEQTEGKEEAPKENVDTGTADLLERMKPKK